MTQPYHLLIDQLDEHDAPFTQLTLETSFILYLVGGQLVLLFLWWLLRGAVGRLRSQPASASSERWGGIAFILCLFAAQVGLLLAWPYLASVCLTARRVLLADIVVVAHFGLVVAVLTFLLLILVGWPLGWNWTRNFWLRLTHLIIIIIVAGQEFTGVECPFTTLERHLRGDQVKLRNVEGASSIGQFCDKALFDLFSEGGPIFLIVYISLALLVLATWAFIRPRLPWEQSR